MLQMASSHLQVNFLLVFLREVVDAAPRYLVSTNSNRSSSMFSDFTGILIAEAMVDMLSGEGDKNIAFRSSCSALLCTLFILWCRFPALWFPICDLAPLDLVIGIQEARILWFHQSLSPLDSYLLIKTHLCFFKVTFSIRIVFPTYFAHRVDTSNPCRKKRVVSTKIGRSGGYVNGKAGPTQQYQRLCLRSTLLHIMLPTAARVSRLVSSPSYRSSRAGLN